MGILAVFTGDKQRILFLWNIDSHWWHLPICTLHVMEIPRVLEKTMGLGH